MDPRFVSNNVELIDLMNNEHLDNLAMSSLLSPCLVHLFLDNVENSYYKTNDVEEKQITYWCQCHINIYIMIKPTLF